MSEVLPALLCRSPTSVGACVHQQLCRETLERGYPLRRHGHHLSKRWLSSNVNGPLQDILISTQKMTVPEERRLGNFLSPHSSCTMGTRPAAQPESQRHCGGWERCCMFRCNEIDEYVLQILGVCRGQ